MKPIQFILIPVLLFLIVLFSRKLKAHPFLRWMVIGIMVTITIFTIFLDSSTQIANAVGISRGVDLVIYIALLSLFIVCILLYLRTVRLEQMITQLIRNEAIKTAKPPKK